MTRPPGSPRPGLPFWLPRGLALLYAAFLALFALDVFGTGAGFWATLGAGLIHLLPSFVLLGALALAWRRPGVGAALFLGLGALWLGVSRGEGFGLAAPLVLIGGLFGLEAGRVAATRR